MASIFPHSRAQDNYGSPWAAPRLARAMTLHASLAVLAFAAIQLWGVVALADQPGGRILPFLALLFLLLAAVPFARHIERRWHGLASSALPSAGLEGRFRRDRGRLWRMALLVPTIWIGAFGAAAEASSLF
ncbi:MAG: hypothetical protein ABL909_08245 [Sphingopyxis sp.]